MTKTKRKRRLWLWAALGALAIVAALAMAVAANLPKPQRVSDASFDLATLPDSTYVGVCDNGIVLARVEVDVRFNAIADVRILEHRNGLGAPAEAVAQAVVAAQSVEVDAVAGATMSSQTILKAVENALSQ